MLTREEFAAAAARNRAANGHWESVPLMQRFWDRVSADKATRCWLWTGTRDHRGYGTIRAPKLRTLRAHRIAFELFRGPIGAGLELDHLCRVRHCVNPAHLEAVTHAENVRRGRAGALKTHCSNGHPVPAVSARDHRGLRVCPDCAKASAIRRRARLPIYNARTRAARAAAKARD